MHLKSIIIPLNAKSETKYNLTDKKCQCLSLKEDRAEGDGV